MNANSCVLPVGSYHSGHATRVMPVGLVCSVPKCAVAEHAHAQAVQSLLNPHVAVKEQGMNAYVCMHDALLGT